MGLLSEGSGAALWGGDGRLQRGFLFRASQKEQREFQQRESSDHVYAPFPGGSDGRGSAYNAEALVSIPGSGRSSGGGNGNPLQYPCLENPMDRGAWRATVHGDAKSRTPLNS